MIVAKVWHSMMAQINKIANWFWTRDPIAQMQYEYDLAVAQMKSGREGLETYRALVERVSRQVAEGERKEQSLTARVKAHLTAGDRDSAGKLAIDLQETKKNLAENRGQLKIHEDSYNNNLLKIKHASEKLGKVREKIQKYDAELKMSSAEAEVAKLSESFNFNVTTDFGQIEQVIQEQIDKNRAVSRVASDLSTEGIAEIKAEQGAQKAEAEALLSQFEVEMGLKTPQTAEISEQQKQLGRETQAQS